MPDSTQLTRLEKLDHRRYNIRSIDGMNQILDVADSFIRWLRKDDPDINDRSVREQIDSFVTLITANGSPGFDRDVFRQVSFRITDLRSEEVIANPRASPRAYLLHAVRAYRPQARQELPSEAVYFARSVTRQLETLGQTQRQGRAEEEIMQAVLHSLSANAQSDSSSTSGPPLTSRMIPRNNLPTSGTSPRIGVSGIGSPGAQQVQTRQHMRTPSGAGTSGRREELESGSLGDLRNRRSTSGSFSPGAQGSLVQVMSEISVDNPIVRTLSGGAIRMSGPFQANITPFAPEALAWPHQSGNSPQSRSSPQTRGRSNTTQTGPVSSYGPSAHQAPQSHERSQSRGRTSRAAQYQDYDPGIDIDMQRPTSTASRSRTSSFGSMAPPRVRAPGPNDEAPRQPRRMSQSSYSQGPQSPVTYPQGAPNSSPVGVTDFPPSSYGQQYPPQQQSRAGSRPPSGQSDQGQTSSRAPSAGRASSSQVPASGGQYRQGSASKPPTKQGTLSSFFKK